jgi:transposase
MARASKTTSNELGDLLGPALEVLPQLLAEGRTDEVLAAFRALLNRNEQLERLLANLDRKRMKTNEGVSSAQLMLFVNKLREQAAAAVDAQPESAQQHDENLHERAEAAAERARQKELARAADPKRTPLKKPLPAELPRRDNLIEVPEAERPCPRCGDEREVIGYEVSEVLELIPAQLYVRHDRREKRACRTCEAAVVRAPRGDKIVEGGQIGCSVVAETLFNKYDMGWPLHRQRRIFQRMGISLSTSTLADQVKWGAELLRPLWEEAIEQVLGAHVMHIDGTSIVVLDRDHPNGKRRGALWSIAGATTTTPEVAAYFYASTKKAKGQRPGELGPSEILGRRTGIVVSDADTLFIEQRKRADLIDCGCNMHARRYFVKALDAGDTRAALVIGAMKGLYHVEDDYRDADPADRLAARIRESTPIYDDIIKWCQSYQPLEPPKSALGRAIAYMLNHETALRRFESDGSIPIDNMAAEHNFVSVALTRKNYLFAGSDTGGERAAIAYTILRCCRLADVEPVEYLTDVLSVLSRGIRRVDVPKLMPASWAAARRG